MCQYYRVGDKNHSKEQKQSYLSIEETIITHNK